MSQVDLAAEARRESQCGQGCVRHLRRESKKVFSFFRRLFEVLIPLPVGVVALEWHRLRSIPLEGSRVGGMAAPADT